MKIATIKYYDIANGEGVRTSVFVSGCRHMCKNCFNEVAWGFDYGDDYTKETHDELIKSVEPYYVQGMSFLGGEPFEKENQADLLQLATDMKATYPDKTLWIYTGFTLEELHGNSRASGETAEKLLEVCDVLVDGRFVENLKDISLKFRGSSNQRVINMNETRKQGKVVLYLE